MHTAELKTKTHTDMVPGLKLIKPVSIQYRKDVKMTLEVIEKTHFLKHQFVNGE